MTEAEKRIEKVLIDFTVGDLWMSQAIIELKSIIDKQVKKALEDMKHKVFYGGYKQGKQEALEQKLSALDRLERDKDINII